MACDFCGLSPGLGRSGFFFFFSLVFETKTGLAQCESRTERLGRFGGSSGPESS